KNRAKPDKAIRGKVKELTKGLKGKKEKVRALYNYVATKIRYVAIELGRGRIQPHKASEVFHNKYGDCKDKATLLISMLKVAGIKAHPVLILSGLNEKTRFEEPPPGRGLNHAIVAVEMDEGLKFLDPTCDVCPYEYLPDTDRSKKALAIIPRKDYVGKIVEMDEFDPKKSRVKVNQEVEISKEGDLNTSVEISHSGYYSYYLKSFLESYSRVRQERIYRGILSQHESGAQLKEFSHSDLEKIDERLTVKLSYEKKGFADTLGDSLIFQTPPTLRIPLDRSYGKFASLPVEERKYPLQMIPAIFIDEVTISFPEDREIVTPDGVDIETEWVSYNSSYEVTGKGQMTVTRKLVKKKSLLPLEGYPEFKELVNKMRKDQQRNLQIKE
ncbi:MAG: transglutaminase family protein, partial [Candidatus Bipolaricaulia bacterium]